MFFKRLIKFDKNDENNNFHLKSFGEKFKIGINTLISREVEKKKNNYSIDNLEEITHQAIICENLIKDKIGNYIEDFYSIIEKYMLDKNNTCPFIIAGVSGSGKSTFMAEILKKVRF